MIHPFRFLFGYTRLRIPREAAASLMNLCAAHGLLYRDFSFSEGYALFSCPFGTLRRLRRLCFACGISVETVSEHGLPSLVRRYRHRVGAAVGLLLFVALVFLSEQCIWDVRVEGNERLRESEVCDALRACGLSVGSWRRELDVDAIENRVLMESDEISWISVNVMGTVAKVEIREVEPTIPTPPRYAAADLVASRGGTIEDMEDVRGNVAVSIGDDVAEGDLLVGGLYGGEGKAARYTCARGRILARTEHEFSSEISFQYEEKRYTGRVFEEKYWIFFENEIKFYGNSGNYPPTCDTIEIVDYFHTPSGCRLPFGIRTVRRYEYVTEVGEHTEERAEELARYLVRAQASAALSETELLGMHETVAWTADGCRVHLRVRCIENIAKTVEIPIKGLP